MALQPFSDNYEDNSTEAGFQFTFYCDICREGYKTKFIESSTYKKGRFLRGISGAFGAASSMLGGLGRGLERGADILSERFHGMSPDWQREHDQAFELAQNEAKGHFHRCPRCRKWVCENDWNEQDGLCVECAPRQNVEIAAARAKRITEEIEEAASQSKLFTGKIESKQTICPRCGKPSGEGKFCNNCGASLKLNVCPRCGAENSAQSRFCGECGNRLQ